MSTLGEEITIDGVTYCKSDLTEEAVRQLESLRFVDARLSTLNNEWAIADTARLAYSAALKRLRSSA